MTGPLITDAAAAALELIHCASLVHDDLPCFDDADIRRGKPTVHRAYGEPVAVLTGDSLIVMAFEVLARAAGDHPLRAVELIRVLAQRTGMPGGICAGQGWESEPVVDLAAYHRAKTGALFIAATQMGAIAAGQEAEPWEELGARIGEAFQVADDLQDALMTEAEMGKPAGQDAAHARPSAVQELGVAGAVRHLKDILGGAIASIPSCPGEAMLAAMVRAYAERMTPRRSARRCGDDRCGQRAGVTPARRGRQPWAVRLGLSPRFPRLCARVPGLRRIARREGEALFDIVQGFVQSQALLALVELRVLHRLAEGPAALAALAGPAGVPLDRMAVLAQAGAGLGLMESRGGMWRLTVRGAAFLTVPGLEAMVRHHPVLYRDLADPVAFFRGETQPELAGFWPYVFGAGAAEDPGLAQRYSDLMADSQGLVAADTLRLVDLRGVGASDGCGRRHGGLSGRCGGRASRAADDAVRSARRGAGGGGALCRGGAVATG